MRAAIGVLLLGIAAFQSTDAACPNSCSGHGRCTNYEPSYTSTETNNPFTPNWADTTNVNQDYGYDTSKPKKDSCTCFLRSEDGARVYDFTNPDCSGKTCPVGKAYNAIPYTADSHAQLVECSNVGTCDRATGKCRCQPGFTGKACNRRTCPNNCNGRGQCKLLSEIISNVVDMDTSLPWNSASLTYTAWDADISAGCLCDTGFRGPDCSLVECPSDSDPMGGWGRESGRECSGRGQCDYEKGVCKCFSGYHGTACEQQLVDMI